MDKSRAKNISESQVEESFVANLTYLAKTLRLSNDIKLIARQLKIKGGEKRIDLLMSHGKELCLVELKVVKYNHEFLEQTMEYSEELERLQQNEEMVSGNLNRYLLVTEAKKESIKYASEKNVTVIVYKPTDVLKNYFEHLSGVAPFLNIKPNDYGVYNIGLINRTLLELSKGNFRQRDIQKLTKLSSFSTHNHLRIGKEFGLVRQKSSNYFLRGCFEIQS